MALIFGVWPVTAGDSVMVIAPPAGETPENVRSSAAFAPAIAKMSKLGNTVLPLIATFISVTV
jgi:hypothetical protein